MSQAEAPSAEKRAQILTGAAAVFAEEGYEGASMAGIAARAGVSKGTLYNYFPSKAALFAAYIGEECRRNLVNVLGGTHDPDAAPETVLRQIGRRMLELMLSPVGQTVYRVVIAEAAKFPELAQVFFEAGPSQAIGGLAEWLNEQTRRGRLNVPDPEFAADQFFNLCRTRLVLRQQLRVLETPAPEEVERVVEAAVSMFLLVYGRGN